MMHGREKSDPSIVAMKLANKPGQPEAESVERREGAEGNTEEQHTRRTPSRGSVSQELNRVREAAQDKKKERFTALLHHVTVDRLRDAFSSLKREAAPGVDGATWQSYRQDLEVNLTRLHEQVHRGTYRALPSRRRYIPKPDGRQRPLGSPRWRTRSFNGLWCRCSTPSMRKISWAFRMGSGPDADSTMRWTRWPSGSP